MTYLKLILLASFIFINSATEAQIYPASNFTLQGHLDPETNFNQYGDKYSGCWGWFQSAKNKEYAIACSANGTYWVDISVPSTPSVSCYRAGKLSGCTWREVKTYQNYCYVVSDDQGSNSFQIFDMQYLPDSVHKVYDSQSLFNRGHTLWVDGNKLYVAGVTYTNNNSSSMNVYSLSNPASPTLIRKLEQDYSLINYVHDMYVRNDTVYASCGYQGLYVFKLMASNTFSLLGSLSNYQGAGYNHSSALTSNGQTLVFMDEVPTSLPIKVANVSNLSNIQVLATINQFTNTTPHNPFIVNNQYCFVSSYQDGLQLFDISTPNAPFLAGYFDTYPLSGGNNNTWPSGSSYEGQWGAYPYFPSKSIFALDQLNGIFILNSNLYKNPAVVPNFTISNTTACVGSTLSFSSTSTGATNYTWTYSGGSSANATSTVLNVSFPVAGIYSIALLAANPSYSVTLTKTITILNNNLLTTISSTNSSCGTCSTGAISVSVTGGNPPFTYSWQPQVANTSSASNLSPKCYTVSVKDVNGCATSTVSCISFFTDLNSFEKNADGLLIYPNPAQTVLHIDYTGASFDYYMYNKAGQFICGNKNNLKNVTLSLTEFPKGMYSIEIVTQKDKIIRKIIIE